MVNSVSGLQFSFSFIFLQFFPQATCTNAIYVHASFLSPTLLSSDIYTRASLADPKMKLGLILYMYITKFCISDGEEN